MLQSLQEEEEDLDVLSSSPLLSVTSFCSLRRTLKRMCGEGKSQVKGEPANPGSPERMVIIPTRVYCILYYICHLVFP